MTRSSHRERAAALLLVWSLLVPASGCSYAFVHGPPALTGIPPEPDHPSPPSCTTSNAAPVIDTVLATTLILLGGAVVVGAAESGTCSSCYLKGSEGGFVAVGAGLIGLGALSIASAATGYGRTADCRRMQETSPGPPQPSARFLLDVGGIAEARASSEREGRLRSE